MTAADAPTSSQHERALQQLNRLGDAEAKTTLTQCCGSSEWVRRMLAERPFRSPQHLLEAADEAGNDLGVDDWLEAFSHHPRIGERPQSGDRWAGGEQAAASQSASETTSRELADLNRTYEERFGFVYLVCATGRSADDLLAVLKARVKNTRDEEIVNAAIEQRRITRLRIAKLLEELS